MQRLWHLEDGQERELSNVVLNAANASLQGKGGFMNLDNEVVVQLGSSLGQQLAQLLHQGCRGGQQGCFQLLGVNSE